MTVIVPLTQGYEAIVDDEDAERVLAHRWTAQTSVNRPGAAYAKSRTLDGSIQLHRFIMDFPSGMDVDHINGDGLDNRRVNLRVATRSQNLSNTKVRRSKFGYLGVLCNKGRYYAEVCCNYKIYRAKGGFATVEEAALARDKLAVRLFGEFASLNFEEHRQTLLSSQPLEERLAKDVTQIPGCGAPTPKPNPTVRQNPETTSVPLSVTTAIGQ